MPDYFFHVGNQSLALWFTALAILATFLGLLIIKPAFRLLIGTEPGFNDTVGHATASFSLFYGLLLGLLTVAAYQNSERVRESIANEATTLGGLYSQMAIYPEPTQSAVKWLMRDYTLYTVLKEWPAHRKGKILNGGFNRSNAILRKLSEFEPKTASERIVHSEAMIVFQQFLLERQKRLAGVRTRIPVVLWYAVLVGATINLLLLVVLRMRILQHFVLGTIIAFFLGVILFVIVTLDRPLEGPDGLSPRPFEILWARQMSWDEPVRHRGM